MSFSDTADKSTMSRLTATVTGSSVKKEKKQRKYQKLVRERATVNGSSTVIEQKRINKEQEHGYTVIHSGMICILTSIVRSDPLVVTNLELI